MLDGKDMMANLNPRYFDRINQVWCTYRTPYFFLPVIVIDVFDLPPQIKDFLNLEVI